MLRLDDHLDAQHELYSEVLSLRKELMVVQEDEKRLRDQLGNMALHEAALKPEVTKEWNTVEMEASDSPLKEVWEKQMAEQSPERMDWTTVNISDLHQRARAARKDFQKAEKHARGMLSKQKKKSSKTQARNEEVKDDLQGAFDEEMENLREAREKLRQIEAEEHFHYHRGTGKRREAAVEAEKLEMAKDRRRAALENGTIEHVGELQYENDHLQEETKKMDHVLRNTNTIMREKEAALQEDLQHVEGEGDEEKEVLERLMTEDERITRIREDLHKTLLYVRAHHKIV